MEKNNTLEKRKCWLFVGLVYAVLSPILLANFVTFVGARESLHLSWTSFWIICNLGFFFFLWKCSYKKAGTKLLTLYLWISPFIWLSILLQLCGISLEHKEISLLGLRFGLDFYTERFNSYSVSYLNHNPWTMKTVFCTVSYVGLFLLFYYLSYAARNKNRSIKLLRTIDAETFISIQTLQKEETLDALNKRYQELITEWPNFEPVISTEYKVCKMRLNGEK